LTSDQKHTDHIASGQQVSRLKLKIKKRIRNMKHYNNKNRTPHPFKLVFAEGDPKYLVIGSFPTTVKKMSFNFFYPNANNKFWKVMSEVFTNSKIKLNLQVSLKDNEDIKIQNEENRKQFCRENKIATTDMLASCFRLDDNSKVEQLLVAAKRQTFVRVR